MCGANDAPTELMELSETEALSPFNNDVRRVRYIYTDLNDGCRNENIDIVLKEAFHYRILFFGGHLAVENGNVRVFEHLFFETLCFCLYRF